MAQFIIERRLKSHEFSRVKPAVTVTAAVTPELATLLHQNFGHEVLLQKPIMFGSLPMQLGRTSSGLPRNTHLLNFLRGGDTVVITVDTLLRGYTFEAQSIWDAIAFEEFARTAFERFELISTHAAFYVDGATASRGFADAAPLPPATAAEL